MLFRASVDSPVEFCSRWIQCQDANSRGDGRRVRPQRSLVRYWLAGLQTEFDRALHSRPITRVQLLSFRLVESAENSVKMFRSPAFTYSRQPRAQLFIRWRTGEERLTQSTEIETGSANQQYAAIA